MPRVLLETKHFQASKRIRTLVNTLRPGDNLPVARDLRARLDISHGTAMRALKHLSDEGVIVREMGRQRYRIADRFERINARISVVRPDFPSRELDDMVRALHDAGQSRHWKFNQYCYRQAEEIDFVRIMGDADGMVFIPSPVPIDAALARALVKPMRPVVVLLQHVRHPKINNVCLNDFRIGELAVETLHARGHRRILFIKDQPADTTMAERYRGFCAAAKRLGLPFGGALLHDTGLHAFENAADRCYATLTERVGEGVDFTAVFGASSVGGMVGLRVMRERELKVPGEVAVLAFGGEANIAPYLYPPLSCIEIDADRFGEYAAQILDGLFAAAPSPASQIVIEPKVVLRASV